jgi:hypothetical protein
MTKAEFREKSESFVNWLSNHLHDRSDSNKTLHQWKALSKRAALEKGDVWSCVSLYDAHIKYYWKVQNPLNNQVIFTLAESDDCLKAIQEQLIESIKNQNTANCLDACEKTLKWGGVFYRKVATDIRELDDKLPEYLAAVQKFISRHDLTSEDKFKFGGRSLQVDSGSTKIFSLLDPNWVIYDGRVGAALGLLVKQWSEQKQQVIPEVLKFAWGYETRRNPNPAEERPLIFPKFGADVDRFKHNLYANWLLEYLLEKNPDNDFKTIRAIESALFMIGYCVNDCLNDNNQDSYDPPIDLSITGEDVCCLERIRQRFNGNPTVFIPQQRGNPFTATLTEDGIEVSNLPSAPLLPWEVFTVVLQLLSDNNGSIIRGNAMNHSLGDDELPIHSVEGCVARKIYGKQIGESVYRRISPIANILVWAGICEHGRGELQLTDRQIN